MNLIVFKIKKYSMQIKNIITGRTDNLYISGFHTVLSISSYYAQIINSSKIALGATKEQVQTLDTLEDSFKAFENCVQLMNTEAGKFEILLPVSKLTKAEIAKLSLELKVPVEASWSCLKDGLFHCGECEQCKIRKAAFKDAGIEDPTTYLSE
jgi:7-cyano-7-deazaguanine synthase